MDYLNVVVDNGHVSKDDLGLFFSHELFGPVFDVSVVPPGTSIYVLLIQLGSFTSLGQAKKNWNGPREIPEGFSEFTVGKLRRKLYILNPVLITDWEDYEKREWDKYLHGKPNTLFVRVTAHKKIP